MSAGTQQAGAWPTTCNAERLQRFRTSRDRGVAWLTAQVGEDGTPAGSDLANAWWRAPWALVVGGAPDVAARMMGWIERTALDDDGSFRPGRFDAPPGHSPVYHLSPVAIAAWLLGRYDTAKSVMSAMARHTDPVTGGVYESRAPVDDPVQDTLMTSQLGISALVSGDREVADGVARWLIATYDDQTELPDRFYSSRRHGKLVTEFPPAQSFSRVLDFGRPQQPYFQPGIAAAFLAGYHQQTGDETAWNRARRYLDITTGGGDLQFDDATSVQVCKFGWGAAAAYTVDADPALRPWVVRMGEWFVRRQESDGSWAPASFMSPDPGPLDFYWKTAEHVMELSYVVAALEAVPLDDR
ncbi:hypothetical protein ABII15_35640 [Streptomyces sp. HUAS MG91]|uniref:Squalene cyclase C-terminal domain-containing protein n=1 Tax=Streptomyces tabacisoli TaxID=3156398 RepID=A0AAU8J3E2_9ACTN